MATSLALRIALSIAADLANSVDIGSVNYPLSYSPSYVFTDGTGASQAKEVITDTRTLSASASEDLDLSGGFTDVFGNTVAFDKIKALIFVADAGNSNDVVIGGAASNAVSTIFGATTHTIKLKPGGMIALVAPDANGYDITAATADLLKVANGGAGSSVTYTIVAVGTV